MLQSNYAFIVWRIKFSLIGVWFFNDTMKKKEPYLYAHERSKRQKAGKKGMPTVIMYLPPEYDNAFNLFIGNRIANKKIYGGMYLML